jgi:hypothetical protein
MAVVADEPIFLPGPPRFIAGMQFRFDWTESEVSAFIEHYVELKTTGSSPSETILTLAKKFKRRDAEVAILIMDLGERGYITSTGRGKFLHFKLELIKSGT